MHLPVVDAVLFTHIMTVMLMRQLAWMKWE